MKKKEEQTRLYIPIFGILIILGVMLAICIYLLIQIATTPEPEDSKPRSSVIITEQKKTNIPESKRETSYEILMEKTCNRNFSAESEDDGTIYFFKVGQKVQIIEYSPPYDNYVVLVDEKLYLVPPNYVE